MAWNSTMMRGRFKLLALLAGIAVLLAEPIWMNLRSPDPMPAGFVAYSAEGFRAAQQAGRPILVDVYASWCSTCRSQQAALSSLLEDPRYASVEAFRVDFDSDREFLKTFGVRSQSTIVVFAGAQELSRSVGVTDENTIEEQLEAALRGKPDHVAREASDPGVDDTRKG